MTGGREVWGPGRRLALGLARGVAMGAADVVPGVSGGTIAVVLGIYERLLGAIRGVAAAAGRLLRGDWRSCGRRLAGVDWWLIVPLLVGILGTILLLASVIETQLEERPETMAGLFCGLVLASAVSACRLFEWRGADQNGGDGGVGRGDLRLAGTAVGAGGRPVAAGAGRGRGHSYMRHDPAGDQRGVPAADAGHVRGGDQHRHRSALPRGGRVPGGCGGWPGPVLDGACWTRPATR